MYKALEDSTSGKKGGGGGGTGGKSLETKQTRIQETKTT